MFDKLLRNIVPIIVGFGVLVIVTFLFILVLSGRDVEAYTGSLGVLVQITVSTGLISALVARIGKNVNGNQSKLLDENKALREAVTSTPTTGPVTTQRTGEDYAPPLMTEDTLARIDSDRKGLPSHRA